MKKEGGGTVQRRVCWRN